MTKLETYLKEVSDRAEALNKPGAAWHLEIKLAASQADIPTLLKVVEKLIEQRNAELEDNCWDDGQGNGRPFEWAKQQMEAELEAIIEGGKT